MTVIAYKDGVMASDSAVHSGNLYLGSAKKILRTKGGILVGGAGEFRNIANFFDFIEKYPEIKNPLYFPYDEYIGGNEMSMIMISPSKKIWCFEGGSQNIYQLETEFTAEGNGYEIAMGAMSAGASAREAVEITCNLHKSCLGPIQEIRL